MGNRELWKRPALMFIAGVVAAALVIPGIAIATSAPEIKEGPADPVAVVNPLPLPVDVTNMAAEKEPVVITGFDSCPTNGFGCSLPSLYTVPAGKRLIIESVSFLIDATEAGDVVAPFVFTSLDGQGSQFELGTFSERTRVGGNTGAIVLSQNVKLYAGPETDVGVGFLREVGTSTFGYGVSVDLHGYLEPTG